MPNPRIGTEQVLAREPDDDVPGSGWKTYVDDELRGGREVHGSASLSNPPTPPRIMPLARSLTETEPWDESSGVGPRHRGVTRTGTMVTKNLEALKQQLPAERP